MVKSELRDFIEWFMLNSYITVGNSLMKIYISMISWSENHFRSLYTYLVTTNKWYGKLYNNSIPYASQVVPLWHI